MFPPNQHQCQGRGLTSKTFGGQYNMVSHFLENFKNEVPSWSVNQQTVLNDGYVNKKECFLNKKWTMFQNILFCFQSIYTDLRFSY